MFDLSSVGSKKKCFFLLLVYPLVFLKQEEAMGELLFLQERMFVYQIILPYPNIFLGNLFRSIYIPQSREVSFQFHFSVYLLPIAKEETFVHPMFNKC